MRAPFLVAVTSGLLVASAAAQTPWKVGERLPHVHLPAIHGGHGAVDLASFRGKKLLLLEFASW